MNYDKYLDREVVHCMYARLSDPGLRVTDTMWSNWVWLLTSGTGIPPAPARRGREPARTLHAPRVMAIAPNGDALHQDGNAVWYVPSGM